MEMNNNVNPEAVETVSKPWPFSPIRLEVTPDIVKRYFEETPSAVTYLLDELLIESPWTLQRVIDNHREDFTDFICSAVTEDL